MSNSKNNYKIGKKVSIHTMIMNILLSIAKLTAGILGHSSAMIADAIHTMSDVVTTVIVILGLTISSKDADQDHPYGHEKFESALAKLVSIILFGTGILLGYKALQNLIHGSYTQPGGIALVAAALSIVAKEFMYRYTLVTALKIQSVGMEADAWHHRSDALTSIGTFIGILGARFGLVFLDPVAAIVVSIFVMKVGVDLYIKSMNELVDKAADQSIINHITRTTMSIGGVENINDLKTRIFGNKVYVDLAIAVNKDISVEAGHLIAENVHNAIELNIPSIKHCMVHVEPF